MLRHVTTLCTFALLLAVTASAQTVTTVGEINAIPQSQIDQLNALGDTVTGADIQGCGSLIFNALCNESVTFTAVVMTDPLNSGLRSLNSEGRPGAVHFFVRDVTTDATGPEGQGIQVADGGNLGYDGLVIGDVVQITGTVNPFNSQMQVAADLAPVVVGSRDPSTDAIFDPIVITTSDLNADAGADGAIRTNWDNLSKYRGNFVRFEGATALTRTLGTRVDWNWTSDATATSVAMYDISLRYRNDRSDYPSNFNVRSDDYVPPTPGATVNVQGFPTFNGGTSSDPYSLGVPNGVTLAVNPMDDADVEISASPPAVNNISLAAGIPSSAAPVIVTAEIAADPARALTGASLIFTTTSNAAETTVAGTDTGADDVWSFDISSGLADSDFATYRVEASDDTGATTVSPSGSFRVLDNGITSIAHIQETADGGLGDSPFVNQVVPVDITATVTLGGDTGLMALQDGMGPWSGVSIESVSTTNNPIMSTLNPGDVIHVSEVRIEEDNGLTKFDEDNMTFTVVSTGGTPLQPVVITTDALQDASIAEAHEGMYLEFDDVVVVVTQTDVNIGGPYGEFTIANDGTEDNDLRVDDASGFVSYSGGDPGTVFAVGERLDFVRGVLWYTFGNFKVMPQSFDEIGAVINTSNEDGEVPNAFALDQNYPNPFNPSTSISFSMAQTADVTLTVYDVLGRNVVTLVNGQKAAGRHTVTFDASSLTSGVYMYRITNGIETVTRTMLLMK